MDLIPFRLVPAAVDVIIAGIVLTRFNYPAFGAIAAGTVSTYMFVTYVLTKWRTKYWRAMVEAEQVVKGKAVESMLNFETVKLFAAEKHELKQYNGLIDDWKAKQLKTE
jgi:ABC-type transport system involved in Fe-S cluster assembly fused permease/ATPase subunit